MRKFAGSAGAVLVVLAFAVAPALAAAPKFHSVTSSINSAGALVVNFDERGLGNENVNYVLSATGTATYYCVNRGGKNPSAANKRTVSSTVTAAGSFEVKNGRVVASLSAGPPGPGDFSCP